MKAAFLLSCLITIAASHTVSAYNQLRQVVVLPGGSTTGTTSTTATTTATTSDITSTSPPGTTSTTSDTSTTTSPPPTTSLTTDTTSTTALPPTTSNTLPSSTVTTPITPTSITTSVNTDPGAETTTLFTTGATSTVTSSSASASATSAGDGSNDSGLSTGSIVGISVAGGVAAIAIIAFIVWKFTRKRLSDFDDNEAIKWPELNAHGENVDSHPLPVHNTGRAGFDTGSEASLSRVPSASNYSTPDVAGGPDPYAVPPLPHMNPNQPYRDDPNAASGYYDPYRGPVPGTLEHGAGADDWAGEVIPMTQMAGRASPGPQAAYNVGGYDVGRQSPAPYGASGRSGSPGPQAAYGGRASPGAQAAYTAGRASPGPHAAYDSYGGR